MQIKIEKSPEMSDFFTQKNRFPNAFPHSEHVTPRNNHAPITHTP